MPERILVVATSQATDARSARKGGASWEELAGFVRRVEAAGHACVLASPAGGAIPLEGGAAASGDLRERLSRALRVDALEPSEHAGLCLIGGAGAAHDLADCDALARCVRTVWDAGGVIGAIAEGVAGLLNVRIHDGGWLVSGRGITGTSRRASAPGAPVLEDELRRRASRYRGRRLPFGGFVHVDGQLVSAQNAASTEAFARTFLRLLEQSAAGWANAPGRKRRSAADAAARGALEPRA